MSSKMASTVEPRYRSVLRFIFKEALQIFSKAHLIFYEFSENAVFKDGFLWTNTGHVLTWTNFSLSLDFVEVWSCRILDCSRCFFHFDSVSCPKSRVLVSIRTQARFSEVLTTTQGLIHHKEIHYNF